MGSKRSKLPTLLGKPTKTENLHRRVFLHENFDVITYLLHTIFLETFLGN